MSSGEHPTHSRGADPVTGSFTGSRPDLPVEEQLLLDGACDAFEAKWRGGGRPDVLAAVLEVPERLRPEALKELVALDVHYRRKAGEVPTAGDYAARFADLDPDWLAAVVGATDPNARTASARESYTAPPVVGARVGDFELVEEIGRGGMGAVYRARQTGLNRDAAVKLLLAGPYAAPALRARFLVEAEAVAALEHPHVVKVFAFGEHAGHPFLAMEYLTGSTLAESAKASGPLPGREAAALVAKLAQAVAHAHSRGVVHRDIKPHNVLFGADGEPRLADFGLAKVGRSDLTVTGQILGTPAYMAPEQAAGKINEVGTAADVYALGAVLYDLLTGRPPFLGDSHAVTLQKVIAEDPVRPRALVPAVPRDLETVCLKCLEKDPQRRYPTAQALADDLGRYLTGNPIEARPAGRLERAYKWARRNKAATAVIGLAGLLLLATVGGAVALGYSRVLEGKNRDLETARADAEERRGEAEGQRTEADKQRGEAIRQRGEADRARAEAEKQRAKAREEEARARRYLYVSRMTLAQQAERENDPARVVRLLRSVVPERADQEDVRGFEWHHLWRKHRGEEARIRAHAGVATGLDFSPDGKLVASSGSDSAVRLWDAVTRNEVRTLTGHTGRVAGVAFGGGGKWLVSGGSDGTLRVWEVATGRQLKSIEHKEPVKAVAITRDGALVGCGTGTAAITYNAETGARVSLRDHNDPVTSVAFGPNGRLESTTLASRAGAPTSTDGQAYIAFAPDGRRAVSNVKFMARHTVTVEGVSGAILTLEGHTGVVVGVAFDHAKKFVATCSLDHTVRLWDAATGQPVTTYYEETPVGAVAFAPDGKRLATAGDDGVLRFWALPDGAVTTLAAGGRVVSLSFSADGTRLAANDRLFEMPGGKNLGALPGRGGQFTRSALSPDGRTIFPSAAKSGGILAHGAFSRDGRYATSGAAVWDLVADTELFRITHPIKSGFASACAFSPDGRLLAVGGFSDIWMRAGWLHLWEVPSGRLVRAFEEVRYNVFAAAFSPDGRHLAAAVSEPRVAGKGVRIPADVRIWEVGSGRIVRTLRGHPDGIWSIAYSPDGKRLAAAGNKPGSKEFPGSVRVWDLATGEEVWSFVGKPGDANAVAFSPCGRLLVTAGDDGTVTVFDGTPAAQTPEHRPLPEDR